MTRALLIFLLLVGSLAQNLRAQDSSFPVTRNLDPEAHPALSFEEYQAQHPFVPTRSRLIAETELDPHNRPDDLRQLIIVETGLHLLVLESLAQYQNDLLLQGIPSIVMSFGGSNEADLRDLIVSYDECVPLIGVFLIGDLPTAWFELYDDFDDDGVADGDWLSAFPCDLFFADLDGYWGDTDSNGVYDLHELTVEPDIWVGRVKADNLSFSGDSEADLVNRYFTRNHNFRLGLLDANASALAYVDDDWAPWGNDYQDDLETCWDDVTLVNDINATTAPDYRDNRLTADYEYIQVMVHSGPDAHYFYWNNHNDYALLHNWELHNIQPTAHFYNLFACSNAHFETDNNMGSLYLLDNHHGLVSIGSTKTGSMLYFNDYYSSLGAGQTFGGAMQQWWSNRVDVPAENGVMWQRSWFYGMVTLGDPALLSHYSILAVTNLNIEFLSHSVRLMWDAMENAIEWKVYSSSNAYDGFDVDTTGEFNGSTWQAPRANHERFYRVQAVLP